MRDVPAESQVASLQVLDVQINIGENLRRLFAENRPYITLLLVTVALDAASTVAFMSVLGPGAEQNPFVRYLSYSLGVFAGPVLGKSFQLGAALALSVLTPRLTRFILTTVILMNLFAFVVNMHVYTAAR